MSHEYSETVRRLVDSFSGLTPELQKAAKYILDHPEDVGLHSMRTVAKGAGVKPATISRLSKSLGFAEYELMRRPFRDRLRTSEPGFSSQLENVQKRGADDTRAFFEDLRAQEIQNIQKSLSDEQYPILVDAVETLWSSRRIYVLGLRGSYAPAFLFHYAFQLFRDRCHLLETSAGIFADQLRGIGEQDSMLVISFPPYTQLTIDAVEYAVESGVKIVAITDSVISPAAHAAAHTIITHNDSASFYHSYTAVLAVCQALIALLVAKSGGDSLKVIAEAEKQLSRISAYW
jgi:DNA-binding MurR/RpiR family transcriptional regulator